MSPSQSSSQPADDYQPEEIEESQEEATDVPGSQTERRLLDQVLMQTAMESFSRDDLDDRLMQNLLDVAKRLRGQPWSMDPVAVELVHAALMCQFEMITSIQRDWKPVSTRVTEVLFNDPIVHDRLKTLWTRLSQEQ